MKTPHIVPLSRQAVEAVRALKQITGNGRFVFAGARNKKEPISNNTISAPLTDLDIATILRASGRRMRDESHA